MVKLLSQNISGDDKGSLLFFILTDNWEFQSDGMPKKYEQSDWSSFILHLIEVFCCCCCCCLYLALSHLQ